jgi:hypothetical protein
METESGVLAKSGVGRVRRWRAASAGAVLAPLVFGLGAAGCFGTEVPPQKPAENPLAGMEKDPKGEKAFDPGGGSTRAKVPDAEGNQVAIARAVRQSKECALINMDGPFGEIIVHMTLTSKGRITNVQIPPSHDDKPIGKCVRQAFEHEVIPTWDGADTTADAKVTLTKQ